ncbi:MAG: hypothetical protein K8V42_05645 [Enterococcus aquimarinus]|uniref:Uncharacterized protein n=1 Tax=Enterococcus aquimarinus TaxID=328396 RepID=A0A9E3ZTC5_9ENTE|nr:hypothetical protein [Enterococcus aquimarinus]
MIEVEVIGVSFETVYHVCLADGTKIRVDRHEYQKMKKRLSGKLKVFIDVEEAK